MRSKLLLWVIICCTLSGCVGIMALGAAGSMIVYDHRSITTIERDARIFYIINKEIVQNPRFKDSHIAVTSFNENVLLTGQTMSASLRVLAEKIAKETPNVKKVYDEITIGEPIAFSERSRDTWITGEVRSKMLVREGLKSGSIRVVTEDATVYLMGSVTKEQGALAADVARKVSGVKKVVKIFNYT